MSETIEQQMARINQEQQVKKQALLDKIATFRTIDEKVNFLFEYLGLKK